MVIILDEKSITKKSVTELSKLMEDEIINPMKVLSFWKKYGLLVPNKKDLEKLKKYVGIIK